MEITIPLEAIKCVGNFAASVSVFILQLAGFDFGKFSKICLTVHIYRLHHFYNLYSKHSSQPASVYECMKTQNDSM